MCVCIALAYVSVCASKLVLCVAGRVCVGMLFVDDDAASASAAAAAASQEKDHSTCLPQVKERRVEEERLLSACFLPSFLPLFAG